MYFEAEGRFLTFVTEESKPTRTNTDQHKPTRISFGFHSDFIRISCGLFTDRALVNDHFFLLSHSATTDSETGG